MKLFFCSRLDSVDWDETQALVIRAESYGAARRIAQEQARAPRDAKWGVTLIREDGTPGVILEDFLRG